MTTVEFGGGPTLAARQQFANLKVHGEIPNYAGHVHQLRFGQGHTFAEETHRVAKEYPTQLKRSKSLKATSNLNSSSSNVSNDYPNGMIPGYAGYVPQRKFQHGHRFIVETDACSIKTKSSVEETRLKARDLQQTISAYPRAAAAGNDVVVKHFLDYHRSLHPNDCSKQDDRRRFVEAPIPGYQGFIPRMDAIEVGVGMRFHEATKKSLDRFAFETSVCKTNFSAAADSHPPLSNHAQSRHLTVNIQDLKRQQPIYHQTGMIPRYAGYVPQRKYCVGQTFGDTTRGLSICVHGVPTYNQVDRPQAFNQTNVF